MANMNDWERKVRDAEENLHSKANMMGMLKIEFDYNLNKLSESYYPKIRPLKEQVYKSLQQRFYIERSIEWNEKLLESLRSQGKNFSETFHMQQDREEQLAMVLPKFQDAIRSLEALTKESMQVLRKYEHPPELVLETLRNVMILRGEFDASWESCKVMLSDTYFFGFFINRARNYDRDNVTDEVLRKLEPSMLNPEMEPNVVSQASEPCGALCKWVRAIYEYAMVKRIVQDHNEEITEDYLVKEIEKHKRNLYMNKDEVASAEDKLANLQVEFEQMKRDLKNKYDKTMDPLQETFFEAHHRYSEAVTSPRK